MYIRVYILYLLCASLYFRHRSSVATENTVRLAHVDTRLFITAHSFLWRTKHHQMFKVDHIVLFIDYAMVRAARVDSQQSLSK